MSLYDPVGMPRTLRGTPSHIEIATVSVVNSDGTIDAQMVGRTAIKSQLEVPRWYKPVKGDRILTTDIAGDQNRPIVIAFVSDEKGSSKEPQGGFTNPSEPKTELVSALPGSPVDGQEVYFQNTTLAAEGVVWHLRYRSASSSSHKWEFVGGPAMQTGYLGNTEKKTEALQELTSGPKLTVPVSGEYDIGFSIRVESLEAATRTISALPLINGATGLKGVEFVCSAAGGNFFGATLGLYVQRANLTAAQVLSAGILQAGTQAVNFQGGYITLCPVRVG